MHYSNDASRVRVDLFKASGKFYETLEVEWPDGCYDGRVLLYRAFARALLKHLTPDGVRARSGFWAVCLAPYHEHSHPQMLALDNCERIAAEPDGR